MGTGRHVKLFRNGRNQVIRIPREFELPGNEAVVRKEGARLVIEPAGPGTLVDYLSQLEPLDEQFPTIDDYPPDPVEF